MWFKCRYAVTGIQESKLWQQGFLETQNIPPVSQSLNFKK